MGQITGIVYIKVDGGVLASKEGAELDLGGKEREAVVGTKVYGFKEKVAPAMVTCTVAHDSDTDLEKFGNTVGATLEFETDTGVTYIVKNAFCTKPPKLKDGDVDLEFSGDPAFKQ